ncbi:non-ribosomal peptide synthetase [Pseudoalteromonas rubra]|uniref:non-ribosomal peptide synthetase n=1 Tax=Pseudoalteromonas rubra TaxID=43658 RepID=UPI0018E119C4|nr:non-ribosomal peptide synthetase [Pseudoalteromonas rubra]
MRRRSAPQRASSHWADIPCYRLSWPRHSQDIVIGTPVENRLQSGLQSLQGFFVNTVPLRVSTEFDTLTEYFEHVKSINQQALANQELPLDQLIEGLQLSRSQAHAPLFQILLTVEGTPAQPVSTQFNVADVQLTQQALPVTSSKFDLDINLVFNEQGLALNWVYDSHLFTADYITKLSTHLSQLIAALVPQNLASLSQQSPQQIDMLSEQERQHLVYDVQSETLAYNAELSLHEQISRQAQLTPDAIAIDMPDGRTLSYAQLDAGANRIAAYLQQHYSLSADSMVGVSTERHAEMVMAILAILKTGAAYLPLDPGYPSARLAQIIDDAKPVVTVTDNPAILQGLATDTLSLATLNDAAVSTPYQPVAHQGDNLAYAIYTSGSTGKPKGVAISHRNINALLSWADTVYSREDYVRVLCSTSINFDLSAFELFFTLTRGGTCVLVDNALSLLTQPVEVSLINTVPSAIKALLEQAGIPAGVRVVNLAGEPLGRDVVNQLLRDGHCERVYNLYGPSEDTTYSTCACFTQEIDHAPGIGQVISNTQAFILNDQLALLPYGATGELYLGGDGLARGYLNQPELSAERFIDNPFYDPEVAGSSTRLYRTGDLVRYQSDGTLAFVGRADDQVKIRGFRVELGEISEQLSCQAAIDSAVVLAKSGANGTYLVAYVQPAEALDEAAHSDFISAALSELAGCLPDYMVPKLGRVIPHWPLTANGKINKKALPEVDLGAQQDHYVAPQTDLEQAVCEIWAELLHLDAAQISTTASFFALGGHSLLSVKLAAALRTQLAVELPLSTLFNATTVAEQAKAVAAAEGQALREDIKALPRVMQDDPQLGQHRVAPLSYAQQRLWFIDQLEQGTPQYNMPAAFAVDGELDLTVVEAVLQTIIARHEVLRTVYRDDVQVIRQDAGFTLSYEDVRTLSETAQQQAIAGAMAQQLSQPFDLTREVMVRAGYIQTTERSGVLLFNMHHIASDGWSMQVLINEFTTLYQAYSQGEDNPLAPLSIQYADYAQWQRSHLNHEVLDTQLSYWQQQLADLPSVHSLPLDYPRPALKQHQGGQVKSTLSAQVAQGLSKLASAQGLTPFMLLHGALSLLLSRHSNARDIVIGTPVANRMQAELAPLIGFFVNPLVLNVNTAQPSLADYLAHVKAVHLGAQSHQDVPFEQLVEQLNVPRSSAYTPLFQVMLTTRTDYAVTEQVSNQGWSLGEAQLSPLAEDAVIAKFDLDIDLTLSDAGVEMCWTYDKALFSAARIETLSRHLSTLLTTLAQQAPATLLAHAPDTLAMLSAAEQHTLLLTLNDNALSYDTTQSIHGLFEQQVQRTPQATALIFNGQHISYEVLNQRANQLAHYLLSEHQVTPETPLGVCSSRSVEMVVSILAILKAGGAYVPLDPSYPASRLGYIAKDAGLTHILAYDAGLPVAQALMAEQGGSAVDIATLTLSAYAQHNPALTALGGDKLAYAIYTSGSTGQPKGVAISHRNVNALLSWADTEYSGEDYARMLCSTSINFDLSAFELFLPLTRGGSCVLVDSALSLLTTPVEVTLINTVPSAIKALLEQGGIPGGVRVVNLAGEPLGRDVVNQLLAGEHCERVYNLYGPSEDTTYSTCARFTQPLDEAPSIGRVINNSQAFILNDKLALLPYGTTGELYLGGDGLARGYLNQPQLSAERFIDNPFYDAKVAGSSKRLYRTGDLVRYQADGNLAFVGRADDQVKIRGFRVELGEISEQLSRQAAIDSAVVLAKSGANGLYLVAYIHPTQTLGEADHTDFITAALTSLAESLPEYMVPRLGQVVPEWPLTASGKINKKALPEVDATALQGRYVAPQTDTEQAVCEIWAQLLNVEAGQISTQTDFFELGGHSLLVMRLATRLNDTFAINLAIQDLYQQMTVANISRHIDDIFTLHASDTTHSPAASDFEEFTL